MTTVKDFIYLNVDRLNSLYSQVFEGVVETIVHTELNEEEGKNTQKGGLNFSGSTIEERVAAASYKTESRLLYDHMYNLLEKKINMAIKTVTEVTRNNYQDEIQDTFLIKVHGSGELWDFKRLRSFFEQYNDVGLALSYITNFNAEQREILRNLKSQLETAIKGLKQASSKKAEIEEKQKQLAEINKLLDPVEVAKKKNLQFDQEFIQHLSLLSDMFYSDGIEVIIQPQNGSGEILFRGILDRQWFRINPETLRMLHAGHRAPGWVMVGQVTYIPDKSSETSHDTQNNAIVDPTSEPDNNTPSEANPMSELDNNTPSKADPTARAMRDGYRGLVNAYHVVESTFSDNKTIVEIVLHPLAIYREFTIEAGSS